jgi:ABC-type uncharacterized transport system substrate-binding protein
VFSAGTDAVTAGLNRLSSNATGISFMVTDLSAKRVELLIELRPLAARLGLLVNPGYPVPTEPAIKKRALGGFQREGYRCLVASTPS